jgi:hypothetical protein
MKRWPAPLFPAGRDHFVFSQVMLRKKQRHAARQSAKSPPGLDCRQNQPMRKETTMPAFTPASPAPDAEPPLRWLARISIQ